MRFNTKYLYEKWLVGVVLAVEPPDTTPAFEFSDRFFICDHDRILIAGYKNLKI